VFENYPMIVSKKLYYLRLGLIAILVAQIIALLNGGLSQASAECYKVGKADGLINFGPTSDKGRYAGTDMIGIRGTVPAANGASVDLTVRDSGGVNVYETQVTPDNSNRFLWAFSAMQLGGPGNYNLFASWSNMCVYWPFQVFSSFNTSVPVNGISYDISGVSTSSAVAVYVSPGQSVTMYFDSPSWAQVTWVQVILPRTLISEINEVRAGGDTVQITNRAETQDSTNIEFTVPKGQSSVEIRGVVVPEFPIVGPVMILLLTAVIGLTKGKTIWALRRR